MNFLELVASGKEPPEAFQSYWMRYEIDPEGRSAPEYFGITEQELRDVRGGARSFRFIALRYLKRRHLLTKVLPGTYVQFITEHESAGPCLEYGWVDRFIGEKGVAVIQCDDCYFGNRSVEIGIEDVLRILPSKERPNVFYKSMLCGECRDCSRHSGEFVSSCPFYGLFKDMKRNRQNTRKVIREHIENEKAAVTSRGAEERAGSTDAEQDDIPAES